MATVEMDDFIDLWDSSREPKSAHRDIENERNIQTLQNILQDFGQSIVPEHRAYLKAFGTGTGPMLEGISTRTIDIIKSYEITDGKLPPKLQLVGVSIDEPYLDLFLIHNEGKPDYLAYIPSCIGGHFDELHPEHRILIAGSFSNYLYVDLLRRQIHDSEWRALLACEPTGYDLLPVIEDMLRNDDTSIETIDFAHSVSSIDSSDGREIIIAEHDMRGFRISVGCQDQKRITQIVHTILELKQFEIVSPLPRANERPYQTRGSFSHNLDAETYDLFLRSNPNLGNNGTRGIS